MYNLPQRHEGHLHDLQEYAADPIQNFQQYVLTKNTCRLWDTSILAELLKAKGTDPSKTGNRPVRFYQTA